MVIFKVPKLLRLFVLEGVETDCPSQRQTFSAKLILILFYFIVQKVKLTVLRGCMTGSLSLTHCAVRNSETSNYCIYYWD